jgi:hypothetical protein
MLNRVRKHFDGRTGGDGICGSRPSVTKPSAPSDNTRVPFMGVVSQVPWTDETTNNTSSSNNNSFARNAFDSQDLGTANMQENVQTFNDDMSTIDFSAIGDMIDGPVDWDMWDDQIMQQHAQHIESWDDTDLALQPTNPDTFVAGNAMVPNGTAPIIRGNSSDMQFNWQDMQDVDLDIRDYGTGGLWGKSPGWEGV